MPRKAVLARPYWENQFHTPSRAQLIGGLTREHAGLVSHARQSLLGVLAGPEIIAWHGYPWRWTIVFRAAADERPWAYLIPQPARPRLALTLDVGTLSSVQLRRISKYLKEGLAAAPRVGNTCWPEWDLLSEGQTEELIRFAQRCASESLAPVA